MAERSVKEEDAPVQDDLEAKVDDLKGQAEDETPFDNPQTDKAIDDIVREESDELLDVQDRATAKLANKQRRGFWGSIGHGLAVWWHNKPARWITLLLIVGGIATVLFVPTTRYWLLNAAGMKVSSSLNVVDLTTGQPLKDIEVSIGDSSTLTDASGKAVIQNLRLGPTTLTIEEPGFAGVTQNVTMGLGSNPLGEFSLKAVGVQYVLNVTDLITGKPVQGALVTTGNANAQSDKNGKAVLTLPGSITEDIAVAVSREGFREEQVTIKALSKNPTAVGLVTAQRAVFVGRDNGRYDVFSADADGKNKRLLLAGTGNEGPNIALVTSPDGKRAALVSTRDNKRDADGFLLSTLTLINIEEASSITLAHAEQVQLVDWQGTRLVFEQVIADEDTPADRRHSIVSYDYQHNTRLQLATSADFNTVLSAQGTVFYAVAASEDDDSIKPAFYRVSVDGSGKQKLLDKEIWSIYRTDYTTLSLQTPDGWYTYNLTSGELASVASPASFVSRGYADKRDDKQSLWVDNRDSVGMLLRYDRSSAKDTAVQTQAGMAYPVRWLTDQIAVYRVVTDSMTADFAASTLDGHPPRKIADVVNTYGFSQGN